MKIDPYYQRWKCTRRILVFSEKFYADIRRGSLERGHEMRK